MPPSTLAFFYQAWEHFRGDEGRRGDYDEKAWLYVRDKLEDFAAQTRVEVEHG